MKGKHASDLRFCGCRQCSYGLTQKNSGKWFAQYARRCFRRQTKQLLRLAVYDEYIDIPDRFGVGYTD